MSPSDLYSQHLEQRERSLARLDRLHGRLGIGRLVLAALFLILAWACLTRGAASPLWLLVPATLFVALVLRHQRVQVLRGLTGRAATFYRSGLERLQGRPRAGGPSGEQFIDEHHLYGADLDLFGKQSLFARLCTARTPMGQSTWRVGCLRRPTSTPSAKGRRASPNCASEWICARISRSSGSRRKSLCMPR